MIGYFKKSRENYRKESLDKKKKKAWLNLTAG